MNLEYDFSGIATAYDVLCKDGRVIEKGAFDHQAGQIVPVVWRHDHEDIRNYLGHTELIVSETPSGIRARARFNSTTEGVRAKKLVENGDIAGLSIWANELIEHQEGGSRRVKKGTIREVSLVLASKNPAAWIDDVVRHSEDPLDPDMIVLDGIIVHNSGAYPLVPFEEPIAEVPSVPETEEEVPEEPVVEEELSHEEKTLKAVVDSLNDEQTALFDIVMHKAATGEKITPATDSVSSDAEGKTLEEVYKSLTDEQKTVLHYMAGKLSQEQEEANISQGEPSMNKTHNIFEGDKESKDGVLSHEMVKSVIANARDKRVGSLREAFIEHSVTDIDFMFPDARKVDAGGPMFYTRPQEWVEKVLNACSARPFSRIKSMYADLTPDAARAKGYVTGAQKVEEVIAVLKRVTTPQTVYKLQKLDRDDILDITDFDVVQWLKAEMRMMLREELARAVLISDGRSGASADKIIETNVRPIYSDDPVYVVDALYNDAGNLKALASFTANEVIDLIDFIADARKDYRGSGSPVFYCQPEVLTKLLLVRDTTGRRIYPSEMALAEGLRVSAIVEVPPMSAMARTGVVDPPGQPAGTYSIETLGVIVNLRDYIIGMDKGGQTSFFDDFDLDFNQYKYLYETRLSGALVTPASAISVELVTAYAP